MRFSILLVLLSALLHAAWNALLKRAEDLETATVGVFLVVLLSTGLLTLLLPGPAFATSAALFWALAAGLGEGAYFLCLVRTMERAPLGWAYTWMRGSAVAFAWPISLLFMGEVLQPLGVASVLGLMAGLALVGGQGGERWRSALAWALGSGVFIAGFNVAYKHALAHGAGPVPLFMVSMAVGLPIQLGARVRRSGWRSLAPGFGAPFTVLLAGLVCTTAFLCYLVALRSEGPGLVLTLRNVSVVFAMLFAVALGEKPPARQWLGALLVTAGAIGLSWPR